MMMNIRGLVLGDPEHTIHLQSIRLPTIQFELQGTATSEIEEVV